MRIIRHLDEGCRVEKPVVALGNFDGIHVGHQKLIETTVKISRSIGGTPVLFTFYPHPLKVINSRAEPFIIQTFREKARIARSFGIEVIVCVRFTKEFAQMTPEEFVKGVLVDRLGVECVCVGHDYTFGKNASGSVKTLREYGLKYGFRVVVIPPVKIDGIVVSSTKIREFLANGDIENANRFLGRPYRISGVVKMGAGRGRRLGFPTANIYPKCELILKSGVYAGYGYVEGKKYKAAINVGSNPTFRDVGKHVEVHLIGFGGDDLYKRRIEVEFIRFIRDEKRFKRVEDLVNQIKRDVEQVKKVLSKKEAKDGCY